MFSFPAPKIKCERAILFYYQVTYTTDRSQSYGLVLLNTEKGGSLLPLGCFPIFYYIHHPPANHSGFFPAQLNTLPLPPQIVVDAFTTVQENQCPSFSHLKPPNYQERWI